MEPRLYLVELHIVWESAQVRTIEYQIIFPQGWQRFTQTVKLQPLGKLEEALFKVLLSSPSGERSSLLFRRLAWEDTVIFKPQQSPPILPQLPALHPKGVEETDKAAVKIECKHSLPFKATGTVCIFHKKGPGGGYFPLFKMVMDQNTTKRPHLRCSINLSTHQFIGGS